MTKAATLATAVSTGLLASGGTSTDITTALGFTPENTTNKNQNSGYAGLDSTGKVASAQLPSYVDDVLEYANQASLPATGETGKIYLTVNNNKVYRWSGSVYVEIVATPGSTDSVTEGSTNLYYTDARVATKLGTTSIDALSDVDTTTSAPTNSQALVWNSSSNKWVPGTQLTTGKAIAMSIVFGGA